MHGRVCMNSSTAATMALNDRPLQDAYTIVTGGSRGIGYEAVKGLMAQGCHVVIAARNMEICKKAAERLTALDLPGSCQCAQLDLEDAGSIKWFVHEQKQELKKQKKSLAILVNNAGVMGVGYTADGKDRHMLCNHLGPFMLTQQLSDCLKPGSRVVNVASRAHRMGQLNFDNQGNLIEKQKWWMPRYCDSKLANVLFTSELQKRWGQKGIASVSVSPGFVSTTLFDSLPWPANILTRPFLPFIARSPAKGAETVIWAATSPEVKGTKEQLFLHDCKPMEPIAAARDEQLGSKLWDWSQRMMDMYTTHTKQ